MGCEGYGGYKMGRENEGWTSKTSTATCRKTVVGNLRGAEAVEGTRWIGEAKKGRMWDGLQKH